MRTAIEIARKAGRKVAFTLSDVFCISRHGDDFRRLLAEGQIDILFANENELTALAEVDDFEAAVAAIAPQVPVLVATRSEQGAIAVSGDTRAEVPAGPTDAVAATTGPAYLFAAGFRHGHAQGPHPKKSPSPAPH